MFWMFAKQAFRNAHKYIQPPCCLKRGRTANDSKNGKNDVHRGFARLHVKNKAENEQTNATDESQPHAAVARSQQQTGQNDTKLQCQHEISHLRYFVS